MTHDAEAQALRTRLEAGSLLHDRLKLASDLGHAASRQALGKTQTEGAESQLDSEGDGSLEFWGRRLATHGPQVMLRAAAALSRQVAISCEAPEDAAQVLRASLELCDQFLGEDESPSAEAVEACAKQLARTALALPQGEAPNRACLALLPLLRAVLDLLQEGIPNREELNAHYLRVLEHAEASGAAVDVLQTAVRDELTLWALA